MTFQRMTMTTMTAIEMTAAFHLEFQVHKGVAAERNIRDAQFAHDAAQTVDRCFHDVCSDHVFQRVGSQT